MTRELPTFGCAPKNEICTQRDAAYAVVFDEAGRVAVIEAKVRGRGYYWLPGGGIESGESPEQAISRELVEEIGHHGVCTAPIGLARQFFFAGDDDCWYDIQAKFFLAELGEPTSTPSEFPLQWVDLEEASERFFHACHAWAVRQARAGRRWISA